MSTLSSSPSPSPSLPNALWSLVQCLIFPILCIKLAVRCRSAGKSEWKGLAAFAAIGLVEFLFIIVGPNATFLWMSLRTWGLILYPITLFISLVFVAVVKDEMGKNSI